MAPRVSPQNPAWGGASRAPRSAINASTVSIDICHLWSPSNFSRRTPWRQVRHGSGSSEIVAAKYVGGLGSALSVARHADELAPGEQLRADEGQKDCERQQRVSTISRFVEFD